MQKGDFSGHACFVLWTPLALGCPLLTFLRATKFCTVTSMSAFSMPLICMLVPSSVTDLRLQVQSLKHEPEVTNGLVMFLFVIATWRIRAPGLRSLVLFCLPVAFLFIELFSFTCVYVWFFFHLENVFLCWISHPSLELTSLFNSTVYLNHLN